MIRSSRQIISDLIGYGVRFTQKDGELIFTREGAHSRPRILYREDETGKEITGILLKRVRELPNVKILEYLTMTDMIEEDGCCCGVLARGDSYGDVKISADYTIFASGGIGGNYSHSTNYPHLTGGRSAHLRKTRSPSGTSGLCADSSYDAVFGRNRGAGF